MRRRATRRHRPGADPRAVPLTGARTALIGGLGRERIELLEFTDMAGRPYPLDSTSTDLWFQHMAIVVNDMTHAHQQVMANPHFRPISREGPVDLPDSPGGVTAFKFRDHDGHPLEPLAFPEGRVRQHGVTPTARARFSASITPPSRLATRPAARDSSGPHSGSAPEPAPRTAGPNRPLSTTSKTSTSAPPGSRRICLRHGWTARYHAGTRLPIPSRHRQQRHPRDTLCAASRVAGRNRRGARTLRHALGR